MDQDPSKLYGAATLKDLAPAGDAAGAPSGRPAPEAFSPTLPGTPPPGERAWDARPAGAPPSGPTVVDPANVTLDDAGFDDRYELGDLLGEGGMGQVKLVADRRIGRRVAMKVIRAGQGSRTDARARFVREARVQGQLEHPSVVPVYDMGITPDGAAFFTMKRVRGVTLAEVIELLRAGDAETAQRYSRRRLLTAFSNVCLTVHFAHTRGVLHRDLKPGNVMLGDFGEVYVLDWGLAKIAGAPDAAAAPVAAPSGRIATPVGAAERVVDGPADDSARTVDGELMGTPGYMAPEQLEGPAGALDARADVYALGSMLFEILTLEPLHGRGGVREVLASTLDVTEARASVRVPTADVPPELEEQCVRATHRDAGLRMASAAELHAALERYLDGDRDLALRRDLAAQHARAADEAATRALDGDGDAALGERRRAMNGVSRALALDPSNKDAVTTMVKLLTAPPKELPAEARADLARSEKEARQVSARLGALTYASFLVFAPLALVMGIRNWPAAIAGAAILALNSLAGWVITRREEHGSLAHLLILSLSTAALAISALMFGPFIMLPALVAVNTMSFSMHPGRVPQWLTMAIGSLAFVVPLGLEWAGVLAPSYRFVDGALVILPRLNGFPPLATTAYLVLGTLATIVVSSLYAARFHRSLQDIEQRVHLHAWQLKQLVPDEASDAMRPADAAATNPLCAVGELKRFVRAAGG